MFSTDLKKQVFMKQHGEDYVRRYIRIFLVFLILFSKTITF